MKKPIAAADHDNDQLCAANWVKRLWRGNQHSGANAESGRIGFPSTSSIASAPYRKAVLTRISDPAVRQGLSELRAAAETLIRVREAPVPGLAANGGPTDALTDWLLTSAGRWVFSDTWHGPRLAREYPMLAEAVVLDTARRGKCAAKALAKALSRSLGPSADPARPTPLVEPNPHLAVLIQDLDGMGEFLSSGAGLGALTPETHRRLSARLSDLAARQRAALRGPDVLAVPVYAGGDDLFAFAPAAYALSAAKLCHDEVPADLPTASTAVLFFHHMSSLRQVVREASTLLAEAKAVSPAKHALAVGFMRRSGTRESSILPWRPGTRLPGFGDDTTAADLFTVFTRPAVGRRPMSPRIVADLERDATELASLQEEADQLFQAEVRRLTFRHGGDDVDAGALAALSVLERRTVGLATVGRDIRQWGARVAMFLGQECQPIAPVPGKPGKVETPHD